MNQFGSRRWAITVSAVLLPGVISTYRRVQVDEDGTGDVFATAGLGEEGLVRTILTKLLRIGVGAAIRQQAVLEEVAEGILSATEQAVLGCA
jgi:hypothetical protein